MIQTIKLAMLLVTVVRADGSVVSFEEASFHGLARTAVQVKGSLAECSVVKDYLDSHSPLSGVTYACFAVRDTQ